MKTLLLFFCCLLLSVGIAAGQQLQVAKGAVYRGLTYERVPRVLVTNLKSNTVVMSEDMGTFTIKAQPGDSLSFNKTDYGIQYMIVNGFDLVVHLQPEIKLREVRVVGQSKRQELSEIMQGYRNKGLYFDGKPPVTVFLPFGGSPLTGLRELFGRDARNMRNFARFAKNELEASEVDRRYNRAMVTRVTGLTDSTAIRGFMEFWRPSYEDLKLWGEYDLMRHIKTNYEYFKKNGDRGIKLPEVSAPVFLGGPGEIKIKKATSQRQ